MKPITLTSRPTFRSVQPSCNPTSSIAKRLFSRRPTFKPIGPIPTQNPIKPSFRPIEPTSRPIRPTPKPSPKPTFRPTSNPSKPTSKPTFKPTYKPTSRPTYNPSRQTSKPTFRPTQPSLKPTAPTSKPIAPTALPVAKATSLTVDWSPFLGPVKQQGNCGSCWVFSAVSALEAAVYIKYKVLNLYSEQQVVDCDRVGSAGCLGGNEDLVWQWINTVGGITLSSNYPYTSGSTGVEGVCRTNVVRDPKTISKKTVLVQSNSPTALINAITIQPVTVAIAGGSPIFQFYVSGTLNDLACGAVLDHAILAVGYGIDSKGIPFIRCKNQWGPSWGDKGYINIAATSANICGILSDAAYPVL